MDIEQLAREHRAALAAQSEFYATHDPSEEARPDEEGQEDE